jgi:Domain of unknown function (DUF4265)
MTDDLTKVHIDLPNHWATGGESLWARDLGGDRYRVENVPFYAYDLNFYDIVEARPLGPELKPSVMRVLERSGHQTIRVVFDHAVPEEVRADRLNSLADLHVSYEGCNPRYFALDLEPEASMDAVRDRLDEWEADAILEYETCEARLPGSFDAQPPDADAATHGARHADGD